MKTISLLLALLSVAPAFAADEDVARAARQSAGQRIKSADNRGSTAAERPAAKTAAQSTSGAALDKSRRQSSSKPAATATRAAAIPRETSSRNVQARSAAAVRTAASPVSPSPGPGGRKAADGGIAVRTATISQSRGAASSQSNGGAIPRPAAQQSRAAAKAPARARAAALPDAMKGTDYKKCRETYFQCMDEFCANKNSSLKRCACSKRLHDFDNVQKNMTKVEDAMAGFSSQLLVVNMEKEDAAAMIKATEGETAYQTTSDKSASSGILDTIAKKLKSSTADSVQMKNMSAINLSMDMDSAFDNVDSFAGASATTKEGEALYAAALPICRDIAAEICDDESKSIAESAYQMAVEQDCNVVAKGYATMQATALEKVREGSALLDMSRLDAHQKRNSDDILTCKKKILDQLSDAAVCGPDLGKCLDYSGRYISSDTGEAILTADLSNLKNMITRPENSMKWTDIGGNAAFVDFLNKKKTYLEPAMANCQDIADRVWADFMEDALAQIKLAQGTKLETIRQSCTSLTAQCLSGAAKTIADFDARALSIFAVKADKTANDMCGDIKTACTALIDSGTDAGAEAGTEWAGGMTGVADDITYQKIMQTCMQVGKECVIKNCKNADSNFGLCNTIDSATRKNILNGAICQSNVRDCISDVKQQVIDNIVLTHPNDFFPDSNQGEVLESNYWGRTYILETTNKKRRKQSIFAVCTKDNICKILDKIWGNCEYRASQEKVTTDGFVPNSIYMPKNSSDNTLLSWLVDNTNTIEEDKNCMARECSSNQMKLYADTNNNKLCKASDMTCTEIFLMTSDGAKKTNPNQVIKISNKWENYCIGKTDSFGNCCEKDLQHFTGLSTETEEEFYTTTTDGKPLEGTATKDSDSLSLCVPNNTEFIAAYKESDDTKSRLLFCLNGSVSGGDYNDAITCSGTLASLNLNEDNPSHPRGMFMSPTYSTSDATNTYSPITLGVTQYFYGVAHFKCVPKNNYSSEYSFKWQPSHDDTCPEEDGAAGADCNISDVEHWFISYPVPPIVSSEP